MDTTYPLQTIRRIAYLDVIQSLFLVFLNIIVSSVYTAYSLNEYDVLLDWLVFLGFLSRFQYGVCRFTWYGVSIPGRFRIYLIFESNQYTEIELHFVFLYITQDLADQMMKEVRVFIF